MKRIIYSSFFAIFISLNIACDDFLDCIKPEGDKETRIIELEAVDAFEIFGACDLTLKQGEEQKIEIFSHPNLIDELLKDSSVEGKTWHVGIIKCAAGLKKSNIQITATIPDLKAVNITGSADVQTDDIFENVDELDLKISGSGDMDIALDKKVNFISTTINGNGDFKLSGEADAHEITIKGSGNVNSFDLSTKTCDIKILGKGDCEVLVSETLDVRIAGSGDLCFKGNPTINSKITGSGNLNDCN